MTPPEDGHVDRVRLSSSQQNIYRGVLQDPDPALYLIGKSYRFHPVAVAAFRSALRASIRDNPIQLCVLSVPDGDAGYPELVARLQCDDIVTVRPPGGGDADGLDSTWVTSILGTPLVRYTVYVDADDQVLAMDVHTHHILLDGASTAIIEANLARHLGGVSQSPCSVTALASVAAAHHREAAKVTEAAERFSPVVRRELAAQAHRGGLGHGPGDAVPGTAARGVPRESVRVTGAAYDAVVGRAETRQVPLNVLVATAALAVHASLRQSTETLLVHPVDNRFGEPQLNVATCLVNSVAHLVGFAPFASVADVVDLLDRGYVKAVRRRWFREELYRRTYLAVNRGTPVEALTVNFMRGRCADELKPYLSEPPVVTDIGPVEGMTVSCVHDEEERTLDIAIWDRLDATEHTDRPLVAERIAAALASMAAHWDQPLASTVDEWFGLGDDGALVPAAVPPPQPVAVRSWFSGPSGDPGRCRSPGVEGWIAEIVGAGAQLGDVLVFVDDGSAGALELLTACHLAGCGYSVCATADEVAARVHAITEHGDVTARALDLGAPRREWDSASTELVEDRIDAVAQDDRLADRLAYIMPTSGSTGRPKLVPVSHGSLAIFCAAAAAAYGWRPTDTVLQCAPLTSDISVEEIFVAQYCGATVVRSTALRSGDLPALLRDVAAHAATVLDLPTAIWQLLCADDRMLTALDESALRQVIIGGEAVRSAAVDSWLGSAAGRRISLISTYGPTETTVVVTELTIGPDRGVTPPQNRSRLGRPLVPDSVFVAFGEVVVVGELVSTGYLGADGTGFGTVRTRDGSRRRAFATADRVVPDSARFPTLTGRRDAVVKLAGKRVDTAEVLRRISADPEVSDAAVELAGERLGVWIAICESPAAEPDPVVARIRNAVRGLGVPSFTVLAVPVLPRKPNGKVDRAQLPLTEELSETEDASAAAGLAEIWSRRLGRRIHAHSSLLDEGIGSLELISILPDTRRQLGWQLTILDLIGADTAANVVSCRPAGDVWMDDATAAEIAVDLSPPARPEPRGRRLSTGGRQTIVILGATGILGTGFAQAMLEVMRHRRDGPDVVFVTRSPLPERDPWRTLRQLDGVRFARLPDGFGEPELAALLRDVGGTVVVNCIGNTNVLVPYRDLRAANVESVSSIAQACANRGARLVHLSTFVVNADVTAARVTDPRDAPYPYAASKSLAELVISRTAAELDFSVVRLPRVLGSDHQLERSADILVAVLDACIALRACPVVPLVEEVTTGTAAARRILGLLPELSPALELGGGLVVLRGENVCYPEFLGSFGVARVDPAEWRNRLDRSMWAQQNPARWAVIDAWMGLGTRLAGRSYADYLADRPTIDLDYRSVAEVDGVPPSLRDLLSRGRGQVGGN